MKQSYLTLLLLIERLHRRFLDVIKSELDSLHMEDINNVQSLILYNIGDASLTIGELTNRGYYLGSNVSYNIKKLVENDYLVQERSPHDKRSVKVKLSPKGTELYQKIDSLYEEHVKKLVAKGAEEEQFENTAKTLKSLEKFWSDLINSDNFTF